MLALAIGRLLLSLGACVSAIGAFAIGVRNVTAILPHHPAKPLAATLSGWSTGWLPESVVGMLLALGIGLGGFMLTVQAKRTSHHQRPATWPRR